MAEPLFTVTPAKRLRKSRFDGQSCIFCSGRFTIRNPAKSADLDLLKPLFDACQDRADGIGIEILCHKEEIYNGEVILKYHKPCRSTYVSSQNIQHRKKKVSGSDPRSNSSSGGGCGEVVAGDGDTGLYTRSQDNGTNFDWENKCFICSKDCRANVRNSAQRSWSLVTTLAKNSTDQSIYEKVLSAATQRGDVQILTRLHGVPNGDLVAADARYHQKKNCLAHYIDPKNINRANQQSKGESQIEFILQLLIDELTTAIVIEKNVFLLSTLKKRLFELARENDINLDTYRTHLLKAQLSEMWPDLSFYEQSGKSYLVCHKDISASQIMSKMGEISTMLQKSSSGGEYIETADDDGSFSEEAIVHRAVGILRTRTKSCVKKSEGEYLSAAEITPESGMKFIDPLLYSMVCWMSDNKLYTTASVPGSVDAKAYNIACDLSTLISQIPSPKHLGLSVHLHHAYGRRELVEDMYSLGYGVSYTEVRQFLTSAAVHVATSSESLPSGALLPHELMNKKDGGSLIVGAADNWDHNEQTVDGKRTTHAMTSLFVTIDDQTNSDVEQHTRIKRSSSRVFNIQNLPGGNLSKVIDYEKPTNRGEPAIMPLPTLGELKPDLSMPVIETAQRTELAYQICRYVTGATDGFPPWGPFHVSIAKRSIPIAKVVYNPILMAPPTDYSTIYTTLLRNKDIANAIGQENLPVYFDMGLLPKALDIVWARPQELAGVIPMEGGMHLLFAVIAGIGTIYGTAGLSELLSSSGVYAAGTVQNIFRGKDFDRGLHALKLLHEVLYTQCLRKFEDWCVQKNLQTPDYDAIQHMAKKIDERWKKQNHEQDSELLDLVKSLSNLVEEEMNAKLEAFREEGRNASATFKFWDDYLQKVSLPLMMMISSTRDGHWDVYHTTKKQLLPLLFASGRSTYAKYMTVQLLLQTRLPIEVQESFVAKSQFVAKLSQGHFNAMWIDYVLEATENKELKGTGGIIGLTLRGSTLARWFLSRPVTAKYSSIFHTTVCNAKKDKHKLSHHSLSPSEIKHWNESVGNMTDLFDSGTFISPFDLEKLPEALTNFATGAVATPAIENSLLTAIDRGESMVSKFLSDRLIPEENGLPRKSFHAPLSRQATATMADMRKCVKVKKGQVSIEGEVMYLRLLAINNSKQVPLERVLSFENSPVPMSMFHTDGTMVKTQKVVFRNKLEEMLTTPLPETVPDIDSIVLDANAIIRTLPVPDSRLNNTSYSEMAQAFLDHIIRLSNSVCGASLKQIHVVFDRYLEDSVKASTREDRASGCKGHIQVVTPDAPVPKDWQMFLHRSENKTALVSLYTEHMLQNASEKLGPGQVLYTSGGDAMIAHMVAAGSHTECHRLVSNQEEADGRLVLHAIHAAQSGCANIVVSSPDTDVLMLLLHHYDNISASQLYYLTGHQEKHTSKKRFIPVNTLYSLLTPSQRLLLLPIYCISGCDSVSAFHGHGKATAYRLLIKETGTFTGMQILGDGPSLCSQTRSASRRFVVRMYGSKELDQNLNKIRCSMAASRKSKVPGKKLPPTEDSFGLHLQRAAYQLMIWKAAHIGVQELPHPTEWGWQWNQDSGILVPKLMNQGCSAPELLNDLICDCRDKCCTTCVCARHKQPCVPACGCPVDSDGGDLDDTDTCKNEYSLLPEAIESDDE